MNADRIIRFCPYCGKPVVNRFLFGKNRAICPDCEWISFEDPKVAVAAVIKKDNQVLLTRRIFPPYQGYWTLPAGFVNAHEDPQEAILREILEETNLQARIVRLLDVIAGREHKLGSDILLVYEVEICGGELKAGDDASEARFFPLDALPPLAFQSTHKILGQKIE